MKPGSVVKYTSQTGPLQTTPPWVFVFYITFGKFRIRLSPHFSGQCYSIQLSPIL